MIWIANSDDLDSQDHALELYRETFLMSQLRLKIILLFQRDFYFGEMNDIFTRLLPKDGLHYCDR
jgi:hypothetical protein